MEQGAGETVRSREQEEVQGAAGSVRRRDQEQVQGAGAAGSVGSRHRCKCKEHGTEGSSRSREQAIYGKNQSGCEKAKKVGFLLSILWVFLTI